MHPPLVSVVIPTHRRAELLSRAIQSSIDTYGDATEVIVVPNGPDSDWLRVAATYEEDIRVVFSPLAEANGNAARNHGLTMAQGKYVRFLDDDDFLLPAAAEQLKALEDSQADMSSGVVALIDELQRPLGHAATAGSTDFVCASVRHSGFQLPVGNLFLRSALGNVTWDPAVRRGQDYAWMVSLAMHREWKWVHLNQPVGVWFQHSQERVSPTSAMRSRDRSTVDLLIELSDRLEATGRMEGARKEAIASAIWHFVHRGFPYAPLHWAGVAGEARRLEPGSRPAAAHFHLPVVRHIPPLVIEWLLLPARRAVTFWRDLRRRLVGDDYRRKI
ncbi:MULTISPECIES: glycosyltransferase family 2 protein [Dyella]|uniref:Glycosyltransferase n=2 Tax=Dyella TaxID=231454 RepID=A0A4R0YY83_9GAMM|nr:MULTISPECIES: glycosyltransferase family 2 protein [Dyella]TBR40142.1 glycosyltransferase [Dyella terrae]TCI12274.1 glycosyltransferase [Dyella soli]